MSEAQRSGEATLLDAVLREVKRVIVGQDRVIERLVVCLLAQGHALLEGLPGLAKTLAAETLSTTVGGKFARIQFTPDLLPADIMGTRIYRQSTETFDVELGPVFVNFLLADEINRAPAKVQSALLEVMAEHQVSIGGKTYPVPEPFLVLATQNPIEQEGVYPLPEAQSDRFLMKILVPYPHPLEEVEIVERMGVNPPHAQPVLELEQLVAIQTAVKQIRVDRPVLDYAVTLVLATRDPDRYGLEDLKPMLTCGASPRASLGLIAAGRALALLRGRDFLVPQDVYDVAADVLRHRLVLSYEALAQSLSADEIVSRVLQGIGLPRLDGSTPLTGTPRHLPPNGAPPPHPDHRVQAGQAGPPAPYRG
ncbi:MAG: AAA domain-containing protein [Streptosporangiales bacterium]|nr:AAA domain-containing protein [Streptosporangiales bacterium]